MIKLGATDIITAKLGTTQVSKIYLGSTEVWSGMDADFSAYLAAGIANGSTMSAGNQAAVEAFIIGCKADAIWTPIKASCLLCAWDSLAGALTPLVGTAPTNNGFVVGDYSKTTGLLGNGSTKYLNTNRNNNADPQNSRHLALWRSKSETRSSTMCGIGTTFDAGGGSMLVTSTLGRYYRASDGMGENLEVTAVAGLWGVSRSGASAKVGRYNSATINLPEASVTPINQIVHVFARAGSSFSNARISFYSIGENLNLSQLEARLSTLMGALA